MEVKDRIDDYREQIYELEQQLFLTEDEALQEREVIRKRISELSDWIFYLGDYEDK
jgi:hypothetical protein